MQTFSMLPVSSAELDRVLERAQAGDDLGNKIADAIALVEGVLEDHGEEAVALSFNGGKDCTVLLHLFAAVLYARHNRERLLPSHPTLPKPVASRDTSPFETPDLSASCKAYILGPAAPPPPLPKDVQTDSTTERSATHHVPHPAADAPAPPYPPIHSVYFTAPNPFPEMEKFVIESAARYSLDLYRFGGGMKAALQEYLSCGGGKNIKAILLGTRQGDPNGDVAVLAPTDPSWPQVLRVHPVLNWSYADVWQFLRELDVPWCPLYDIGFTSLGSTTNTQRNPLLRTEDGYQPAWELTDESKERAGRTRS